jgi:hypothetical protein
VTVTTFSALVVFTTTLPKFTDAGDAIVGATPAPVSAAVSAVLDAVVKTESEVRGTAPTAVGVRVMEILHCEFPASVLPHVVDASLNGDGTVIEWIVSDVCSPFTSASVWAGLVVPTTTFPRFSDAADRDASV